MVKNINFEIFDRLNINFISQTRINVYTLIVKKDFQICEREKSICYAKIIWFSRYIDGFTIPLKNKICFIIEAAELWEISKKN